MRKDSPLVIGIEEGQTHLASDVPAILNYTRSVYYIGNMPADHYYIDLYNQRKLLIVVGQGKWEGPLVESTRRLDTVMCQKGIHARFEYWGYDVDHDWPWWYKMVAVYVPQLLD